MKQTNKMKKTKKIKISFVLKTIVVLIALSAMLINAMLGVSKAEYFKTLSKNLDLEAKPDLMFQYYLYDATLDGNKVPTSTYSGKTGAYRNVRNISQPIIVGTKTQHSSSAGEEIYKNAQWGLKANNPNFDGTDALKYFGEDVVYQIKIPVDETGYYKLDFTADFWEKKADNEPIDLYTQNYDFAVGCEVLNHNDGFIFYGDNESYISTSDNVKPNLEPTRLELWSRNNNKVIGSRPANNTYVSSENQNVTLLESDGLYQWKTLNPSRAERVSLTFKAESTDVTNGYVIWMWEFTGLKGPLTYNLELLDIAVDKTMELDGSTKHRDAYSEPFFMFPQAEMANNQVVLSLPDTSNLKNYDTFTPSSSYVVRGVQQRGVTSYSRGRGSYVTNATANGITLQAETLFYGRNDRLEAYLDHRHENDEFTNPVSLRVPLKNVKFNTTYRVVFDFSLARQGGGGELTETNLDRLSLNDATYSDYSTHDKILRPTSRIFEFQSYLYSPTSETDVARNMPSHRLSMGQIEYNNKAYQYKPLTNYGDIMSRTSISGYERIDYSTSTSVNDTYSINTDGNNESEQYKNLTSMRNWYNAIQHTEYNAQNEIHWLTFYNTSFSFNIQEQNDVNLDNLYWVWAIDSLIRGSYYRIKIENVRIEEVVEYGSGFNKNGVKISGVQLNQADHSYHYDDDSDNATTADGTPIKGMFAAFRGMAGTGQNYLAKGWVLDEYMADADKVLTSATGIYSPIIDATKFQLLRDDPNDYKIELDGWAVLDGGVRKYVFSVDGGLTWEDMTFSGGDATEKQRGDAEGSVDQYYSGVSKLTSAEIAATGKTEADVNHIDFNEADGKKGDFSGYKLVANLEKYKNQANLDVIIAAVPATNPNLRCEILRIINFNQVKNYVTFPMDFVSDISVKNTIYNTNGATTRLNVHRIKDTGSHYTYENAQAEGIGFTFAKTWFLNESKNSGGEVITKIGPATTTGYARMAAISNSYEDIRTAWTGIAVKKTLGITGWAIIENGVQGYYWSADLGKSWFPCSGTAVKYNNSNNKYLVSPQYADYFYSKDGRNDTTIGKDEHRFEDSMDGKFDGSKLSEAGTMLTADLSKHVGEVVDVIFAAKPNGSDVYVPVGRIDNVGVYGDPTLDKGEDGRGMGTFYTKINEVRVDHFKTDMTLAYNDGDYLSQYAWNPALDLDRHSLTYMEPYHVNPLNTRFYNKTVQEVMSGGKIEIEGFTMIEGGVKQYKYSLDGGLTWTIMQTSTQKDYNNITDKDFFDDIAKKVDSTFDLANGDGGGISYRSEESAKLIAILPTLQVGAEENILIVAESNIEDNTGTGSGFLYPVLRMRLKVISPETYDVEYKTMLNVPISKGAFTYDLTEGTGGAVTNAPNASISLPGTYFVEGEPINFTYDYSKSTWGADKLEISNSWNITVMVTTETLNEDVPYDLDFDGKQESKDDLWMTGAIKYRMLHNSSYGRKNTVDLNEILYNLDDNLMTYVSGASYYKGNHLPVGTYKVWLFHDDGTIRGSYNFGIDPFKTIATLLLCEPLTFKVIDKDNPDFSITSYSYAPYKPGVNCNETTGSYGEYNTKLTIPKTVYTQGEKIYFTTDLDYCARQVLITDSTVSNLDQTDDVRYPTATKGITWEYAQHGRTDIGYTGFDNALETWDLKPGQYKIYYFMGENVQYAYRGRWFSLNYQHSTHCKMYTILDITILPNNGKVKDSAGNDIPIDYTQTVTANYTKIDGTKATESGQFDVNGKLINSEYKYGKYINTYHLGIDFTKTITDVRPGTEITFSVTNNIPLDKLPSAWRNKISTIVVRETKKKV